MVKYLLIAFRWLLAGAQLKFVLFTVVVMLFTLMATLLMPLLDAFINPQTINNALSSVHPHVWYFLNLTNALGGAALIVSAYITRFIIRRLPFIG